MSYAGIGQRCSALILDGLILGLSNALFNEALQRVGLGTASIYTLLIVWLYFALLESSASQATFGKALLGLGVTDINGNRISFGRASLRTAAKVLSALPLGLGFVPAASSKRRQALHDVVARTLVVNRR